MSETQALIRRVVASAAQREQAGRLSATLFHLNGGLRGSVKSRIRGRSIQNGNAWGGIREAGGLYRLRKIGQ